MLFARSKTVIQFFAWGLLLASTGGWLWIMRTSVSVKVPEPSVTPLPTASRNAGPDGPQPSDADVWGRLFARRWQRPLFDPPPEKPVVKEKEPTPPPAIQIIATMPEPNGGHAMIQDERGRVAVLPVGAEIATANGKARLVGVYDDHVEVEHAGETITMQLKIE